MVAIMTGKNLFNPLPDGGTIAVVAPSSRVAVETLAPAIAWFEKKGFRVKIHPQCAAVHHQSAGSVAVRAAALNDMLADPSVDAIIAAAGGNRAGTILPDIDYQAIGVHKPVLGFSDTTFILNALFARTGMVTLHGPTLRTITKGRLPDHQLEQMLAAMQGRPGRITFKDAGIIKPGEAQGALIGGNLSVFSALCGTPYMPDTAGAIIFLEDVGDEMSRYDRMFNQLRLSGVLSQAAGLIIGNLDASADTGTSFGYSLGDILADHLCGLDMPVVINAPFGHGDDLYTLPVGGQATLDLNGNVAFLDIKNLG